MPEGWSPYGVMGMGGNVWEWEETEVDLVNDDPTGLRAARGGRWFNTGNGNHECLHRDDDDRPWFRTARDRFRVARDPAGSTAGISACHSTRRRFSAVVVSPGNSDVSFQITPRSRKVHSPQRPGQLPDCRRDRGWFPAFAHMSGGRSTTCARVLGSLARRTRSVVSL